MLLLLLVSFSVSSSGVAAKDLKIASRSDIERIRPYFSSLTMEDATFSDMIDDLIHTLADTCKIHTEYSYWVCNNEDLIGTLLDPDNYIFANVDQFPEGNVVVARTKEGAYIQSILGAILTQKLHFYIVRVQDSCGVNGELDPFFSTPVSDDVRWSLHLCVKREVEQVTNHFKVFLRKFKKDNPLTEDLLQHNLMAGHKLFLEMLENSEVTPCSCVVQPCNSLAINCYNHNTQNNLYSILGSRLYHWTFDAKKVEPVQRNRKRLFYKHSSGEAKQIGYKKLAYQVDYRKNCETVRDRKCVRSKSYEICNFQFKDKTEWYQRYLKKSCTNLCNECTLDVVVDKSWLDDNLQSQKCPGGGSAKRYKCSSST